MFEALGRLVYRRWRAVLAASGLFLVAAGLLLARGGKLTSGLIHGIEAERAERRVEQVLGYPSDATFLLLFQAKDLDPESEEFTGPMDQALAPLRGHPAVREVLTPESAPPFLADSLVSPAHHAAAAVVTLRGNPEEMLNVYPALRALVRSDKLQIAAAGTIPFLADLRHTLEADLARAELLSLPLAVLVLLLVFRTAVAAVLPVLVGGSAVLGGVAAVMGLSHHLEIAEFTINVCSLLGLGVAIDYSLFTVSRYREELEAGRSYEEALVRAVGTAGRVVAFSGLAVGTGLGGLLFFHGSYLEAVGLGGAIVVALAALSALTLLPALLAGLGPHIHAGRLPLLGKGLGAAGRWHRLAEWVMARPVAVLLPTLALLLCMGVPFLRLQVSTADVSVLTAQVEARRGDDLLGQAFPDLALARSVVAVHFPTAPALNAERIGALYDLSRRLARLPHVKRVESIVDRPGSEQPSRASYQELLLNPPPLFAAQIEQGKKLTVGPQDVLLYVLSDAPRGTEEARSVVRGIRAERQVGDGDLQVGGPAALDLDNSSFIQQRTPRAVGFVVAVMVVVLFLLLRSVVLPLKAVAMNFVSIAGSFGALVWVFQDGHLLVREGRPIEASLPVLLFCVIFGLSMDYEVLMLSRMKEVYARTGDNTRAVAEGLERSAGLITSAAAIMVAVFSAFSLARVVLVQAVGFGMALAVALDATLVRVLLVPATMRLFGDLNWWAPQAVQRALERLGLKHEG